MIFSRKKRKNRMGGKIMGTLGSVGSKTAAEEIIRLVDQKIIEHLDDNPDLVKTLRKIAERTEGVRASSE